MTQVVAEEVEAFHNRSLPSQFAVVYLDATFITVKHKTAQKEDLHVLIGITPSGENEYNAKFFDKMHRGFGAAFIQLQNVFGN